MPTRITPEQTLQAAAVAVRDKSVLDSDRYFIDGAITSSPALRAFKTLQELIDPGVNAWARENLAARPHTIQTRQLTGNAVEALPSPLL